MKFLSVNWLALWLNVLFMSETAVSASEHAQRVISVAVFAPAHGVFHYLAPGDAQLEAGSRVWVEFGRSHRVGLVVPDQVSTDISGKDPEQRATAIKPISDTLDASAVISEELIALAQWASGYYHYPLGEVLAVALPVWLRRKRALPSDDVETWRLTAQGTNEESSLARGAVRQRKLVDRLKTSPCSSPELNADQPGWRPAMRKLTERGWVEKSLEPMTEERLGEKPNPPAISLTTEQQSAAQTIANSRDQFSVTVLEGVTGSGKTEVYFDAMSAVLAQGGQVLMLVPEIGLTEQLTGRLRERFGDTVAQLHSGLAERERAMVWARVRAGNVGVLLGTRSAVWASFARLQLIVVDEEHDASYKQQEGFRYSARDIGVKRAQSLDIPIILGSATPSLETLANVVRGRYQHVPMTQRAMDAELPDIRCIDVRGLSLDGGVSPLLAKAMHTHLDRGNQVILFLNRRGYAPLLMCRNCGEPRRCDQCDAYLVFHKRLAQARCHACDRMWPMRRPVRCCDEPDVAPIGLGTEQIEEALGGLFPGRQVLRIDRDTARKRDALPQMLRAITAREVDIVIGTQMIAKGLDFANVTLVGVVDADNRLYSVDFRAEERLAQLLIQVAGRAGRAEQRGEVLIQTHHPHHPVLTNVITHGYEAYAREALIEREAAALPPYSAMALLRAEARSNEQAFEFLRAAREVLCASPVADVVVSYPLPALMERRAGRFRALVVLNTSTRAALGGLLRSGIDEIGAMARRHRVRWSLDIDPQDTL